MNASEKRKQEKEEQKNARLNHILKCTYELFSHGIETVTMNQIAQNAEIGVASLYRYFSTKEFLAIECATYAWNIEENKFKGEFDYKKYQKLNGYNQVKFSLEMFPKFFATEGKFFRFIYYFDAFIKDKNVTPMQLTSYEANIIRPEKVVIDAITKGKKDKSLNDFGAKEEELFLTVTHALFSMAQKLSLSGDMLYMDKTISAEKQMELLTEILLKSLKK